MRRANWLACVVSTLAANHGGCLIHGLFDNAIPCRQAVLNPVSPFCFICVGSSPKVKVSPSLRRPRSIHFSTVHRGSLFPFLITHSLNTRFVSLLNNSDNIVLLSIPFQLFKQTSRNRQTRCSPHPSPQRLCSCQHSAWLMVRHIPTVILRKRVCLS